MATIKTPIPSLVFIKVFLIVASTTVVLNIKVMDNKSAYIVFVVTLLICHSQPLPQKTSLDSITFQYSIIGVPEVATNGGLSVELIPGIEVLEMNREDDPKLPEPEVYGSPSVRSDCAAEVNAAQRNNGASVSQDHTQVAAAAKLHNDWMVDRDCFSHQCPGERSLGERLTRTGYRWGGVGEIIASGQRTCTDAVNAWLNSSGHRAILLGNYRHFGCSTRNNKWTCVFANPL